jgi:hypothetical protein
METSRAGSPSPADPIAAIPPRQMHLAKYRMSRMGQKWPNTNRSLGSRRSTEMNGREAPSNDVAFAEMRR